MTSNNAMASKVHYDQKSVIASKVHHIERGYEFFDFLISSIQG